MKAKRTWLKAVVVTLSLLCGLLLTAGSSWGAFEGTIVDSRAAGMGDCWSASTCGALSLAPLPPCETTIAVSLSYSIPYGLEELAQKNILCKIPLRDKLATLGLAERGGSLYKERILSISVSGEPLESTRISLSLGVFGVSVHDLGSNQFIGLSAGARSRPIRSLEACIGLGNLVSGPSEGALPSTFLFGLLVTPAKIITASAEVRKVPGRPSSVHIGMELEPESGIRMRCGLQTIPVELAMGFAVELGCFSIETASSFHPVLGRTNVFTLSYQGRTQSGQTGYTSSLKGR